MFEHLVVPQSYCIGWKRTEINLVELAKLRWIEKWSIERLAEHFGVGTTAIKLSLRGLKASSQIVKLGLRNDEVALIKKGMDTKFRGSLRG